MRIIFHFAFPHSRVYVATKLPARLIKNGNTCGYDNGTLLANGTLKQTVMDFISSKAHGVLDYLMGFLLIISPWLFNFANDGIQMQIPIIAGITTLSYSMFTDYEHSMFRLIPFTTHLAFDFFTGLVLAASPWLFGFSYAVYSPHLVLGLSLIGTVVLAERYPKIVNRRHHSHA